VAETVDIQKKLDDWLANNPSAQKYVSKLYYVRSGDDVPDDATQTVTVASAQADARALQIAAVCLPEFAAFLDMLLALVATQPGDEDETEA
jgi:hypothetical protein